MSIRPAIVQPGLGFLVKPLSITVKKEAGEVDDT
jgi:hypothetical protein